ncbi:MAG: hypothetical protein DMG09_08595 [Acidobacteria bacterium]|nr:MAG: hypothetical protein DMG09_08595 [Acidobacteriota bacterium]
MRARKLSDREPAMKETPIFRNIQHVPRVWGVTYLKLFATLGGGLLMTTLGFVFTPGATAVVKVMVHKWRRMRKRISER